MSVAATIRSQIEIGVLMALGASDLTYWEDMFEFKARILPKASAQRARVMRVQIKLDSNDTYSIEVGYVHKFDWVTHKHFDNVYADNLNQVLIGLDNVS